MSLSLDAVCSNNYSEDDCLRLVFMTAFSLCVVVLLVGSIPSHAGGFSPFWKGTTRLWQVLASDSGEEVSTTTTTTTTTTNSESSSTSSSNSLLGTDQLQWWQDLAPPFSLHEDMEDDDDEVMEGDVENEENTVLQSRGDDSPAHQHEHVVSKRPRMTHFCFLVHGHRGYSRDLSYMQAKMERVAVQRKRRRRKNKTDNNNKNEKADDAQDQMSKEKNGFVHELVVHSTSCNEKKTDDGVVNGGERLVDEILDVIRTKMKYRVDQYNVTVSFLGNSLGGIYSRYAVAKLFQQCQKLNDGHYLLDDRYHLHFNVFCTTATPHLGIAGHTFLPLPRTAEIGVAHALGNTGKDLFRLNDLMKRMATAPEFVQPLRAFRKRIAYANAYGTDFPVPLQTAAFLSESSTYPHHFVEDSHDEDRLVVDDNGLVIATLHTPPEHYNENNNNNDDNNDECKDHECYVDDDENDELVEMSRSLDSLGWKKVFIDVRKEIPQISLPKVLSRIGGSGSNHTTPPDSNTPTDSSAPESDDGEAAVEPIQRLKAKGGVVSSRDVAAALTTPLFFEEKLYWPMGHNMMVAFSRSRLSTYLHKAGRPVVDSLANELVESIFSWKPPPSSSAGGGEAVSSSSSDEEQRETMERREDPTVVGKAL